MDPFKNKTNLSFEIKRKPSPILFNGTSTSSSPKKLKFNPNSSFSPQFNAIRKRALPSIQEQRRLLPIFDKRGKLLDLIQKHDTLIILGETGCGKTTQIPQYIYSGRLQGNRKIAVTQPRRVAAISVATRVAMEMNNGSPVGEVVGYSVRFEDKTSSRTKIKYLTDGMLLREAMVDNLLMDYNVVILDEAHERTIHTDILFGIVKEAQRIRQNKNVTPLKILIMSATMDVDHFSQYYNNCKVVYLEGRTYPVNIYYTKMPHDDYQTACVSTFFKIHKQAPSNHDVLIFMTGQEEIESVALQIRMLSRDPDVAGPNVKVHTLYAAQPLALQVAAFMPAPPNTRKVIVSTNVAETSVTISGIRYVIDSGMVKARTFHPATGLDMLKVQRISQEQSWQRAGRAGRESEGHCYRIYTRTQFEHLNKSSIPEIKRANLASVVLQLLALGIHAAQFDFIDKPPKDAVAAAFEQLVALGAVESVDSTVLTALGKKMVQFPLDPRFSKVLLAAPELDCLDEALTVVALLSTDSIFLNPASKRDESQAARQKFVSGYGDHITLLNTYRQFVTIGQRNQKSWCHEHYINLRNVTYATSVRKQLLEICGRCDMPVRSCGNRLDQVRKCLVAGLFMNVAELHKDRQYITLDKRQTVEIHPGSVLHGQLPPYLLFTEVVQTTKCYLRSLSSIDGSWLQEVAPEYARSHKIRVGKDA